LAALLFLVQYASAAQMSGFAAMYYQDDGTTPEEPTNAPSFPPLPSARKPFEWKLLTVRYHQHTSEQRQFRSLGLPS
jgi:hypothetical protein